MKIISKFKSKLTDLKDYFLSFKIDFQNFKDKYFWFKFLWNLFKVCLMVLIILIIIGPLYFLISVSLAPDELVLANKNYQIITQTQNAWSNYSSIIDKLFWRSLGQTFLLSLLVIIVKNTALILGGYGISILNKRFKKVLIGILMIFSSVPEVVLYVGLYKQAVDFDLRNSAGIWISLMSPLLFSFFSLIYFSIAFEKIIQNRKKLMQIDNLRVWERIFYVYLPKIKIPLTISLVFTLIQSWNVFLWPTIILSENEVNLISIWFLNLGKLPEGGQLMNKVSAGAVISIILPFLLYFIFSKKINQTLKN